MSRPNIYPLDWKNLEKGSSISESQIREFWHYLYPDKPFDERNSWITVKGKIQDYRASINAPLVIRQVTKENTTFFEILTDKEFEIDSILDKQGESFENKEKAKKRQQNVPIPVDQPEVIGRETKPVTPTLVRPEVIQTSQAPVTAPPTNIAAVSPSLNNIAPPVQNQRVDRRRFAALFPEDADLVQGIGSLRG